MLTDPMTYHFHSNTIQLDRPKELSFVSSEKRRKELTEQQRRSFEGQGWQADLVPDSLCRRYALTYKNRPFLFTRNLPGLNDITLRLSQSAL